MPERLAARPGEVLLPRPHDDRLVPDGVAHAHDALLHARERAGAGVLDEPFGAADGGGAVLAARAEGAGAGALQLARLGLLGGGVGAAALRALRQRLAERE